MKFGFIAKHRGIWPAEWLCEALGVSRGGFYAWLNGRQRSQREGSCQLLAAIDLRRQASVARLLAEGFVRAASDRAIDAAAGSQSPSATASTAARSG